MVESLNPQTSTRSWVKSPRSPTNLHGQPHPQKEANKMGYATVVKDESSGRGEASIANENISSTVATVNEPMNGDHSKHYSSNSGSNQSGVRRTNAPESAKDHDPNPQPFEHNEGDLLSKPEINEMDRHEETPMGDERIKAAPPRHQVIGSGNGTRHQPTVSRHHDSNNTERGQRKPDDTDPRTRNKRTSERERRDATKRTDHTTAELKAAQRHNQDLEERNRHLTNQLAALSTQLHGAEIQHQLTLQLLEAKTSELKGANAFLTKEDALSGAEVITMVDALNAEILQVAAFMADLLGDTDRDLNHVIDDAMIHTVQIVGEPIARRLGNGHVQPKSDEDSIGLQIALQFCLVYACRCITGSWMPGYWRQARFLADIHSQIIENEEQSVSGRWRAITRANLKHIANFDPPVMKFVTDMVGNILKVAGWSQRLLNEQGFWAIFQEKLTTVGKMALRLQATVGETITSGDMQTFVIPPNAGFDPGSMEVGFSHDGRNRKPEIGERVAGTTDIGLQRSIKGSTAQILRKPRVVLCSALDGTR